MAAARHAVLALALALPLFGGPAAAASDDLVRQGEQLYGRCMGCHALGYDRTGPHHCGLFGRRAGSVAGFPYSDAMKRADIVWTARTLDRFLANPARTVPGTSMTYAGVPDPAERRALIAYLQQATRCKPQG
jgi:cytochrome c